VFNTRGIQRVHVKFFCHTVLLWTSHILHTELRLGMSWSSHYVLWSLCNHSVNMLALLLDCTIVEQHAVTWFLWWEGGEILQDSQTNVNTILRENCTTQRKVYQWVEGFQNGRTSVLEHHQDCRQTVLCYAWRGIETHYLL